MDSSFTIQEYMDADCMQIKRGPSFIIGLGLHQLTAGKMCDGCPQFEYGKCESYRALMHGAANNRRRAHVQPIPQETVRQEAARLKVSISEVRRRRKTR